MLNSNYSIAYYESLVSLTDKRVNAAPIWRQFGDAVVDKLRYISGFTRAEIPTDADIVFDVTSLIIQFTEKRLENS